MIETLLLVAAELLILLVVGWAVLAPLDPDIRERLLPAAPAVGAAFIAVVTTTTCRWLSIPDSLPIVAAIAVALAILGVLKSKTPLRPSKYALVGLVASIGACGCGLTIAAIPEYVVGDTNAVAPAYSADEFYFAGVSTWINHYPLLPAAPTDGPPSSAPAADTVAHELRFGQSAVAASLSTLMFRAPYATVSSIGLLWLVGLGGSAFACCSLLGLRRRWAFAAAAIATSSFWALSMPLDGKDDALLGSGMAILAMVLSIKVVEDRRCSMPLVLMAAGLVSTYYEAIVLLFPALFVFALVGPRSTLRTRVNTIAGRWAASAVIAPWAWLWMAESFKSSARNSYGPTPLVDKHGWATFRAILGLPTLSGLPAVDNVLSVVAMLALIAVVGGLLAALRNYEVRALPVGLLLVVAVLAFHSGRVKATLLQDRVLQLSIPALLVMATIGYATFSSASAVRRIRVLRLPIRRSALTGICAAVAILFVAGNLLAVGLTTSLERARNQHLPSRFTAELAAFVKRVGAENVTIVTPQLTDAAAISLVLAPYQGVQYATSFGPSSYVGYGPFWNRQPVPYYVIGPGVSVFGDVATLAREGPYRIVHLGSTGTIVSPFTTDGGPPQWLRPTFMRGFPCLSDNASLVMIRGGTGPETFSVASDAVAPNPDGVKLTNERGKALDSTRRAIQWQSWDIQHFRAPSRLISIITIQRSPGLVATGTLAFPVKIGDASLFVSQLVTTDPGLTRFCLADHDDGADGYDRDITFMRNPY